MNTPGYRLLTELAAAASSGHTRAAITRRVGETLARFLPLQRFELAWCRDDEPDSAHVVSLDLTRADHPIAERRLALSDAPHALTAFRERAHHLAPPKRGALRRLTLPLFDDDDDPAGFATLGFDPEEGDAHAALLEPDFADALTSILRVALHNTRLIERVARLSQRAHREKQRLRLELQRISRPERFVHASPAMQRIYDALELVARYDTTVLLRGESGTGKELLARTIHERSSRANRPFVTVNCGALPEPLVESELFGHERGAFTGASSRHLGRFERADTGTILLDEVAELPLSAQVKLLRVLQEAEFERVGGEETLEVDVRIIAATHRDLEAMVDDGAFRADLYYRLNVFPLHIPPLRERREDIQTLSAILLQQLSERLGRPTPTLPADTVRRLTRYRWPGNVRELENALERALILSRGAPVLEPAHLDPILASTASEAASDGPGPTDAPLLTFEAASRRCIERALRHTRGRIYGEGGAAELLDLKPSTLQSKMKRLGVERAKFVAPDPPA